MNRPSYKVILLWASLALGACWWGEQWSNGYAERSNEIGIVLNDQENMPLLTNPEFSITALWRMWKRYSLPATIMSDAELRVDAMILVDRLLSRNWSTIVMYSATRCAPCQVAKESYENNEQQFIDTNTQLVVFETTKDFTQTLNAQQFVWEILELLASRGEFSNPYGDKSEIPLPFYISYAPDSWWTVWTSFPH